MKNALVTGATGFIGSWLLRELSEQGVEVTAVVMENDPGASVLQQLGIRVVTCDLSKISELPELIQERGFDAFIHLAWAGTAGAARTDYVLQLTNVRCTLDAATAAKKLECRKFLVAGTITEMIAQNILSLETKAENNLYGLAKHTAHCMLDVLCKKLELDYVWMRFSNVYGPNNGSGNLVSYTLGELAAGRIPTFSKAEQPYDLIYIQDLVQGIRLLAEKDTPQNCYFIGSGCPRILKDYLLEIKKIFDRGCDISLGVRPDDGLIYDIEWFSTTPLERDTGYQAHWSFSDGINKTIGSLKL